MQRGESGVRDSVEILVANGGQVLQTDSAIQRFGMPLAAIYGHLVTTHRQPRRQFLGESLKPAVTRWNAACA